MTTTQHTPGPWNFKQITQGSLKDNYAIGGHWLDGLGGEYEGFVGNCIREENARLIAAAPELLGELETELVYNGQARIALMQPNVPDFPGRIELIKTLEGRADAILAAINKATGA